jgi:hypothetical protein
MLTIPLCCHHSECNSISAKALGIDLSARLIARANEVIK